MRAIAINHPVVIMDNGKGYNVKDFEKQPLIGGVYEIESDVLKLKSYGNDSDCVSGVCPIK